MMQNLFSQWISNRVFWTCALAWFAAQAIKTVLYGFINKEWKIERMVGAGGMPSSHSSTVCALATAAAIHYGMDSFQFTISVIFAVIVMHDARGVRRETGKQAEILNRIIRRIQEHEGTLIEETELKELVGHTPSQVFVGGVLGVLIALFIR